MLQRRPCGINVVDQEHVPARLPCRRYPEGPLQVLHPVRPPQRLLGRGPSDPEKHVRAHRDTAPRPQLPRQDLGLVKAPLPAPGRMERDGDDHIRLPSPDLAGIAVRELLRKQPAPASSVVVFKPVQGAGHRLPVKPQAPPLVKAGAAAFHLLPAVRAVFRRLVRKGLPAVHAERPVRGRDRLFLQDGQMPSGEIRPHRGQTGGYKRFRRRSRIPGSAPPGWCSAPVRFCFVSFPEIPHHSR